MATTNLAQAALEATRQWAIEELETARLRVTNLRCGGEAYNTAVHAVEDLTRLVDGIGYMLGEKDHDFTIPQPNAVAPPVEPVEDPQELEVEKIVALGEPAQTVTYELSEVRTKAKEARDAGVKLPEIWKHFGGTKLSDVQPGQYGELMALLEEKMKEMGA